jgi:hypothetical protein
VRRDLADVVLAVDRSGDFAFAFNLRLGAQIVNFLLDKLQILNHPRHAVASVAAHLTFDE